MDEAALEAEIIDEVARWILDLAQREGLTSLADAVKKVGNPELTAAFAALRAAATQGAPTTEAVKQFVAAAQSAKPAGGANVLQTLLAHRTTKK